MRSAGFREGSVASAPTSQNRGVTLSSSISWYVGTPLLPLAPDVTGSLARSRGMSLPGGWWRRGVYTGWWGTGYRVSAKQSRASNLAHWALVLRSHLLRLANTR